MTDPHINTLNDSQAKTRFTTPASKGTAQLAILASALLFAGSCTGSLSAAALDYVEVGPMYMAYFHLDDGQLSWTNESDYTSDGPQVLRPLSYTSPGDFYTTSVPAAGLLNPHATGGQDAAASRLFGFSLSGTLRNYLSSNGYAIAIGLTSVTYAGTQTQAENTGVYYYNRGNDDWNTYHADKAEWSELNDRNYLLWNGLSFSNMVHPLVYSLDDFPAEYTLTYSLRIVSDTTGQNVNATVVDEISAITGILPLTFSYNVQSLGATPVPEPSAYALAAAVAALALVAVSRRRKQA